SNRQPAAVTPSRELIRRLLQQKPDLLVSGLSEIVIPPAYAVKRLNRHWTDNLVHHPNQLFTGRRRRDRHRDYYARGALLLNRLDRRAHGGPGGQPVVDQNDGFIVIVSSGPVVAISQFASIQLLLLFSGDLIDHRIRDSQVLDNNCIQDTNSAAGDGPHCQLCLPRSSELANEKNVQRNAQLPRYFECYRHAAARQSQDDYIRPAGVAAQTIGQRLARLDAVLESIRHSHTSSRFPIPPHVSR